MVTKHAPAPTRRALPAAAAALPFGAKTSLESAANAAATHSRANARPTA
jgi:hypothetical protein